MWIATWGGGLNLLLDGNNGIFKRLGSWHEGTGPEAVKYIQAIEPSRGDNIWLAGKGGITLFNSETWTARTFIFKGNNFTPLKIFDDNAGNVWLHAHDGLALFVPDQRKLTFQDIDRYLLMDAIRDHSGSLWIGSISNFAFRVDLQKPRFIYYSDLLLKPWLMEDKRGIIWRGGKSLDQVFLDSLSPAIHIKPFHFQDGINTSLMMMEDSRGYLWFAGDVLRRYNPVTGVSVKYNFDYTVSKKLRDLGVKFLVEDKNGNLWFGSTYYLVMFERKTGKCSLFYPEVIPPDKIEESQVNDLLIDRYNCLWIATARGVCKLDLNTGRKERFRDFPGKAESLSDDFAWKISEDKRGRVWILCNTALNLYNRDNNTFTRVNPFSSMKNVSFLEMIKDRHGNFWILNSAGLSSFCPIDFSLKHYELPHRYSYFSMSLLRSGEIFISPVSEDAGTYRFHPDSIKPNRYVPPVWISKMKINEKETPGILELQANNQKRILKLNHKENFISFEFLSLNYTESEKNEYRYFLSGIDRDTIKAGTKRYAEYSSIPPGKYTFWVTGSNNEGIWNPVGTTINFQIYPPWDTTKFADVIYFILFILSTIAFIRWRTIRLRREKIHLEAEVSKRTRQIEDQKHEIEQHEEKILEMDEFKTRFFANISHEFRSPLTIIHGISEELSSRDETGPLPNEKFKMISRNAKRLLELVNQLLDISKIISNKMKLELAETDIIDFIRTVAASFSSLAEIKAINYSYHLPIVPKLTWFDRDKIEKVLVNLLSNAFKFTARGGRIILSADYANHKDGFEEMLEFYVADTGIGIPEEALGKIFDRFYQVEESLKKTNGGAGIGLSLVKDLVQIMHGEITVNSKKGEGSIFNVKIPLGKTHLNSNEFIIIEEQKISLQDITAKENLLNELTGPDNQENTYETPSSKPILLIVEDNKDIRIFLKDELRKHFRILEANDGSSGLEMAFRSIPDLVITDLMMPHMSGSELCRLLKSDERTSHIPVVMLTAKVSIEDKLEGLETGADDYISKPFNMKELLLRVINLIDQRRRLREKFSRATNPGEVTVTSVDEQFLTHAISIVEHHIDDEAFDLGSFCKEINLSRSTLFRKLFALTNHSPVEFIRLIRLKKAASLLKQHFGSITEVALEVGFSSPSYFAKCFRKVFGISPRDYVHS